MAFHRNIYRTAQIGRVVFRYGRHEIARQRKVAAAVAVTPGFESPTISPLHDKQWNAVRVMVPKAKVNQLMDDLYEVGARGIIVTALQASRM